LKREKAPIVGEFWLKSERGIGIQLEVQIGEEDVHETLRQSPFRIKALDF
jgi:hypothetical protein